MTYQPRFTNLVHMLDTAVATHAKKPLFGTHQGGGVWKWTSYGEFGELVGRLWGGLGSLGVSPGERVAVISNNRLEWVVAAHATYRTGAAYVPMYESQLDKEWGYILRDSGARICFVATAQIAERVRRMMADLPTLEHVICFEGSGPNSYATLLTAGPRNAGAKTLPSDGDIAMFIYTSGTTGDPKGVRLTHRNLAANVSAMVDLDMMKDDERSLAFLPWAHVFGGCVELHGAIATGSSVAICDDTQRILEYLPQVRPTMLFAVPRIWNRIYDGVRKQMASKPRAIQALFENGMRARTKQKLGQSLSLTETATVFAAEKLLFSKVRERFGGRMRFAFSGAAALSREVAEFVDNLGIDVYEGYGMTECSGSATVNREGSRRLGSVGKPVPGVSVKLDFDAPGARDGEGEVLIYGTGVMAGYHNLPEATRQTVTDDGGLRSGDLGRIDDDGFLFITGRVKELFKLANGKYVAPALLEEQLQLSPYIAQAVIYGEDRPHNVALIVPDMAALGAWADKQGITGPVIEHSKTHDLFMGEIEKNSREFKGYERVRDFFFEVEPLTTENGLLTPTLKLKRRNVMERYGSRFQALY